MLFLLFINCDSYMSQFICFLCLINVPTMQVIHVSDCYGGANIFSFSYLYLYYCSLSQMMMTKNREWGGGVKNLLRDVVF